MAAKVKKKVRKLTDAGRASIAEGARKRWAKWRKANGRKSPVKARAGK